MASKNDSNISNLENFDFDYTLSILIIGASGKGKSTFCNFLINERDHFDEACGVESVTDKVDYCVREIADEKLLVIDCPGLGDPIKEDITIFETISETAILTCDGVDVVGLLINPSDRFSETDKKALVTINDLGGEMWKHTFIIFNNAWRIEKKHGQSPENYINHIRESPKGAKALKDVLNCVDGRFVCVESVEFWGKEEYWKSKSKEIVDMIKKIKKQNNGERYRNEIMENGKVQKMILKHDKQLEFLRQEFKESDEKLIIFIQNQQKQIEEMQNKITDMQLRREQGRIIHGLRDYTLSILVIGTTRCGKSAFCNFFAKDQDYRHKNNSFEWGTKKVEQCIRKVLNEKLLIIDTPGYDDLTIPVMERIKEISETDILTRDGVDAVILIINIYEKFFKQPLQEFENLGGHLWNHTFIVFTHAEKIEKDHKMKAEEYIEGLKTKSKSNKDLKAYIELVKKRYVCIESVEKFGDDDYWGGKSDEIIEMVKKVKNQNDDARYRNSIMKKTEHIEKVKKKRQILDKDKAGISPTKSKQRPKGNENREYVQIENKLDTLEKEVKNLIVESTGENL